MSDTSNVSEAPESSDTPNSNPVGELAPSVAWNRFEIGTALLWIVCQLGMVVSLSIPALKRVASTGVGFALLFTGALLFNLNARPGRMKVSRDQGFWAERRVRLALAGVCGITGLTLLIISAILLLR